MPSTTSITRDHPAAAAAQHIAHRRRSPEAAARMPLLQPLPLPLLPLLLLVASSLFATPAAAAVRPPQLATKGPSQATLACRTAANKDKKGDKTLDGPIDWDPSEPLSSYGAAFAGVTPHILKAGTVTPPWTCSKADCYDLWRGARGDAVLWVPDGVAANAPRRLLYVHGGSWYYGSPFTTGYAPFAAKLARETKMPVLAIDYWLAPIGNFSLILGQVGAAVAYLAKPESVPGVPPSAPPPTSIFIAGDSSGGGSALSALVAQASPGGLPNAGAARLAGGVLYSPWINLLCDTPSYATQAYSKHQPEGLVMGDFEFLKGSINKAVTEFQGNAADYYSGDPKTAKLNDPIANPLFAPPDVLARLPPVSIHTGLPEALAAEQAIFAGRAAAAGALVENHIYDAMWHVFVMYSNGCNAGYGRVIFADNAVAATARFFDRVAAGAGAPQQAPRVPCSVVHYEYNGVDTAAGVTCL